MQTVCFSAPETKVFHIHYINFKLKDVEMFQKKLLLGHDVYLIICNLLNDFDRNSVSQYDLSHSSDIFNDQDVLQLTIQIRREDCIWLTDESAKDKTIHFSGVRSRGDWQRLPTVYNLNLKTESSCETSVTTYQLTGRHIPQDLTLQFVFSFSFLILQALDLYAQAPLF